MLAELGIEAGFIPDTFDLSLVDPIEQMSSEEATEHAMSPAREEGNYDQNGLPKK